jgi:hypothetical protein
MLAMLAAVVAASGLHGTVVRSPAMPVCRLGVPCSAPAVGVLLKFERRGHVVRRVRTDKHGRYRVKLVPGTYVVRTGAHLGIGRGIRPLKVVVRGGLNRRVNFTLDTGIR